jgi:ribose 5-phosphate isomerase A
MTVGLGTGSTVAYLLPALAKRSLDIVCAATSPRTEHAARELGLRIEDVTSIDRFDITIDGADQIAPDGWLVKGGGGAHTREKIVAGAADRFVVIADSSKPVPALHAPIPLELLSFGLRATMRRVAPASLRDVPLSPDGGVIADYHGPVETRRRWPPGCHRRPGSSSTACSRRRWWRRSSSAGASRSTGPTSEATWPRQFDCSSPMSTARW